MHEIDAAAIETDHRDFPTVKIAVLARYERIFKLHSPDGRLVRLREAPQREAVAGSYTPIILSHTQTVASAFNCGLYASGFALVRPTVEALFKQDMLGEYQGGDDGWESISDRRLRVTPAAIRKLAARRGYPDALTLWNNLSPVLNDFVHGGRGQLTSNPINEQGWPQYPGSWFWSSMQVVTMSALVTSGWFWAHIGDQERCRAIMDAVTGEDWGSITVKRNGHNVRIVARHASAPS